MSADDGVAIAGLLSGLAGIGVVAALALRRSPASEPEPSAPRALTRVLGRVLESAGVARRRIRRVLRVLGRRPRERDYTGDDLVASAIVAFAICSGLVVAAVGFADTHHRVLRLVALGAVVVSVALVVLTVRYATRPALGRMRPWLVIAWAADAALSWAPRWLAHPVQGEGRFDEPWRWLPGGGSLADRVRGALKIWDTGLVFHVLAQAVGITLLLASVGAALVALGKQARRRRLRSSQRSLAGTAVLVAAGALLASGLPVALPAMVRREPVWTVDAAKAAVRQDSAPPLALQTDRKGRVTLLFAHCGADRILALEINGHGTAAATLRGQGQTAVTRMSVPRGDTAVRVRLRTTRTFTRTVVFPARPAPAAFLPARTGVTAARFARAGFGC